MSGTSLVTPALAAQGLLLTPPTVADAEAWAAAQDDECAHWFDWPAPPTVERCRGWLAGLDVDDPGSFVWAIRSTGVGDPGQLLGGIDLTRPDGRWNVSYFVGPAHRGWGVARRALSAVVGWALDELGVPELGTSVHVENVASRRVLEAAGFRLVDEVDGPELGHAVAHYRLQQGRRWLARREAPLTDDAARLLATVPEWFGIPEANQHYVDATRELENWAVRDPHGTVVGLALTTWHFGQVCELELMVVDGAHHGGGVGTALVRAVESDARRRGATMLEVKTLGASHPDPYHARTRHFYERAGFLPVEETDLWGAQNPCLVMVKPLPVR